MTINRVKVEYQGRTFLQTEICLDDIDEDIIAEQIANDIISLGETSETYTVNLVDEDGVNHIFEVEFAEYEDRAMELVKELAPDYFEKG